MLLYEYRTNIAPKQLKVRAEIDPSADIDAYHSYMFSLDRLLCCMTYRIGACTLLILVPMTRVGKVDNNI